MILKYWYWKCIIGKPLFREANGISIIIDIDDNNYYYWAKKLLSVIKRDIDISIIDWYWHCYSLLLLLVLRRHYWWLLINGINIEIPLMIVIFNDDIDIQWWNVEIDR